MNILVVAVSTTAALLAFAKAENEVGIEQTVISIAEANRQSLGLIDQIELEMSFESRVINNGLQTRSATRSLVWARDARRERVRENDNVSDAQGRPLHLYDWFTDGHDEFLLRNWDPVHPQSIEPLNQGTVQALRHPRSSKPLGRQVTKYLNWSFESAITDQQIDLHDIAQLSPLSELIGIEVVEGRSVWHIRAAHPAAENFDYPGWVYDFFVDPAVNFQVWRVVETQPGHQRKVEGRSETFTIIQTTTVKKYQDCGDGVFVPTLVTSIAQDPDSAAESVETTIVITPHHVNEPLSLDALTFEFPEHALVRVGYPSSPDHQKVILWGKHNEPLQAVESMADLPGFDKLKASESAEGDSIITPEPKVRGVVVWINVALLVIVVAWLFKRALARR